MNKPPLQRIGGHLGMDVFRGFTAGGPVIFKIARHDIGNQGDLVGIDLYGLNETALHNEAMMLDAMSGSGFTPDFLDIEDGRLIEQDVGQTMTPKYPELWRHALLTMLATIRARGLRHGDLKGNNIITRFDWPWAVDWQEGHYLGDVAPQERPWSDSHLLMQHIEGTQDETGLADIPRVARRWRTVLGSLGAVSDLSLPLKGKTFIDYGCFQGDFVALAAAEGMLAVGVDTGRFRSGEDSIAIGRDVWHKFPFGAIQLVHGDIIEPSAGRFDVAMMFSTWPYLAHDYGMKRAIAILEHIIDGSDVFFFETQLAGDGPGQIKDDEAVRSMFLSLGARCEPIGRFQVTGRPAFRTVWRIEKE